MSLSTRGPRGVPSKHFAGYSSFLTAPGQDPQGAWCPTPSVFLASGTFQAPYSGVMLNKRGKVECFVTACAGGGQGGGIDTSWVFGATDGHFPNGGDGGNFCVRFKIELSPGELVTVFIPAGGSGAGVGAVGNNGASLTFGTYLTLTGGLGGTQFSGSSSVAAYQGSKGGTIISGTVANDNVIRKGARGGGGSGYVGANYTGNLSCLGESNPAYGPYVGAYAPQAGGGGGAGLFGDGTIAGAAAANSGAGGGNPGGANTNTAGTPGGSGQLQVEWKVPA